jgi:flagellin-like protein
MRDASHALRASLKTRLRSQAGITGIEAAIVLIAFVVVASVFAYAVLSAGIFASDKGKEAIYRGLEKASTSFELLGVVKADGQRSTTLSVVDTPGAWTSQANVTGATESFDRKSGTAALRLTIGGLFGTGLVAYEDLGSTVDLSAHYAGGVWLKPSADVAAGVLQLRLDDSTGCGSPLETLAIPALTANTWKQVRVNTADPSALTAVACVGLSAASDPGALTLLVDQVEGPDEVQSLHLALGATLNTAPLAFNVTADADQNGLLSDEASPNHDLVISYIDSDSVVRDLAWTTTELGKGDGDVQLEAGEMFLLTVDLRAVSPVPTANTLVVLHLAPYDGSSTVFEKRMPANIETSMVIP